MTSTGFCRSVERRVEDALEALHIDVTIKAPKRLNFGVAGFCHIPVQVHLAQPNKDRRQFATLAISAVRSEIVSEMVNSHALSLIKLIVKEYASYVDMHMAATVEKVRDANRILSMIY